MQAYALNTIAWNMSLTDLSIETVKPMIGLDSDIRIQLSEVKFLV